MLQTIKPNGFQIRIQTIEQKDYLSLTDLAKFKSKDSKQVIKNWIRAKSTISFLATWETMYNPDFKGVNIDAFKKDNYHFSMSPFKWIK